ncbi:MAG: sulfite exporter TauE/SafE family protein [Bacteroidia bacterium]|nr:sulfite exporter TauE/SafE family protein [Bacteroidia bacterium]
MSLFLAAISLGLLGSFHCIGMCGPIALALPVHQYSTLNKYIGILLYNVGRVLTYSILGLIFGLLGQSFFIGGFQQAVSISIGAVLLLSVFFTHTSILNTPKFSSITIFISRLQYKLSTFFQKKGLHFLFLIGILNGLLPCGLVYIGIAGAIATGHYLKGAEFMLFFGIGTIPVMYVVAFLGQFISIKFRNIIKKSMPVVISVMALLLIIRGLNLGIPYLSPLAQKESKTISCCETTTSTQQEKSCCAKKFD